MSRPHCLAPTACPKTGDAGHCQSCALKHRYSDPAARARMASAKRIALQDPEKRRRVAEAGTRSLLAAREGRDYGAMLRSFAASLTPEQRREHFARRGHSKGLNGEDLAHYRRLKRMGYRAADARRMIDEEVAARLRRFAAEQQQRHRRQQAEAY